MANNQIQHEHSDDDIIIRDQDGTYKILKDGQFVLLEDVESEHAIKEHHEDHGPKRAPDAEQKDVPDFGQPEEQPQQTGPKEEQQSNPAGPTAEMEAGPTEQASDQQDARQDMLDEAEKLIAKSNVTFASSEIRQRVIQALIAHQKGIRKSFETKEQLTKPVMEGGAGLEERDAERIMDTLAGEAPDLRPDVDTSKTRDPENEVLASDERRPVGAELHEAYPIKAMAQEREKKRDRQPPEKPAAAPKPSVMDVKKPQRPTVGLAGELGYSLADWRRVAPNPKDRVKKMESKLDVLEQDGFPERLKGWEAWRQSEVMSLYKQAGKQSLEEGKDLSEMLGGGSPERLSWDEWRAIAEFNRQLRY